MSMDEPLRLILVHQFVKALKTLVGVIRIVVQACRRRVRQQQVDAAQFVDFAPQLRISFSVY